MNLLGQMNEWSKKHHPKWLVVMRIVLGFCLFTKGFEFIKNSVLLPGLISQTPFIQNAPWLASFIPWVHILGGSLILVGLFTRLCTLVQIPLLLGAVFVNARLGMYTDGSDLLFSIIILVLLIFFFIEGGGRISLDNYFSNYAKINKE